MKVIEIRGTFGLDALTVTERPDPAPGPGQVLLGMRAVSLNYRDLMTVLGQYNPKQPLPLIPCSDGVGEVLEAGPGATRVRPGQRVTPIFAQRWLSGEPTPERLRSTLGGPLDGTLAEKMVVDAEGVVPVPEHLGDEEAACLPCAGVTAWTALAEVGTVRSGDIVLVQGTGGVSIFALQLARTMGARVIVTSSSDKKLERARDLGAWATINYVTNPDWGKEARRLSAGAGVDLVVETGGAGTLQQSLAAVRQGGQISVIGVLSGTVTKLNLVPVLMNQVRLQGLLVGHREGFEAMNRAISAHGLRPVVDEVFAFEETRAALETMQAGRHFAKICIRI